jgi:NhaP-type Na+/H+ or K+/H+ antiporter
MQEVKNLTINCKIVAVASIGLAVGLAFGILASRMRAEMSKRDIVFETVEEALVTKKEKR